MIGLIQAASGFISPAGVARPSVRHSLALDMTGGGAGESCKKFAVGAMAALQVLTIGGLSVSPLVADPSPAVAATTEAPGNARGPFEETWQFTSKFFVDRSFNGQDWQQVHDKFKAKIASGKQSESDAAAEMVSLLGDKYSRVVPPIIYSALSKYDLVGVGLMLSPNDQGQLAVTSDPVRNSSASKNGIKKGDLILGINGRSTSQMSSFDVIDFLSKYREPKITFTVIHDGQDPEQGRDIELKRAFEKVSNPIKYALTARSGHKVGYIAVSEFNAVVIDKLREAVSNLQSNGADEFVLDLRGNGGGAFQTALGIAGLFMDDKPITSVVDGDGKKIAFNTDPDKSLTSAPLVVLIDKKSASASEVLASALQDDCRALLQGSKSFGKGLIQAVYGLADGSGLILTVAKYETPRGFSIQGTGIAPDVQVKGKDVSQEVFDAAARRQQLCTPLNEPLPPLT
ncbi:unnamed protein product [Chrysoparadoxa australica]